MIGMFNKALVVLMLRNNFIVCEGSKMMKHLLLFFVFSAFLVVVSPVHAVFIGDSSGGLYDLNVATNTSTYLGNSGVGAMLDIAQDPTTSSLYGVTGGGSLYSLSTTNGSASFIGGSGAFINGLTFDSSGTLFGSGGGALFTVNLGTGAASTVGFTGFSSSGDIAFDSLGNLFLSATGGDRLVSVNSTTGVGSLIGSIGYGNVYGLNFWGSTLYGFTSFGDTITIDTTTGAGTFLASNSIGAYGADGAGGVAAAVPEPSTMLLLGSGLLGMVLYRRKRGKASLILSQLRGMIFSFALLYRPAKRVSPEWH